MESYLKFLILPLSLFGITAISAMGLQLILGGAGLLTLGHTAFFAIGGYASAAFVIYLAPVLGITSSFWLLFFGILFAMAVTAFFAFISALPCLKLRGDYLAVSTMGLGQIAENTLINIPAFGGASGFTNVPHLTNFFTIWLIVALVALFLHRFYQTNIGHEILCSRDDEVVARCFGISPKLAKLKAFIVGNMVTAIAGALYVHTFQFISPVFAGFQKSVEILLAVVIGGMFSLRGSIIGAAILALLPELLRFVPAAEQEAQTFLPSRVMELLLDFSHNSMLLFSLIVLVILRIKAMEGKGSFSLPGRQKIAPTT